MQLTPSAIKQQQFNITSGFDISEVNAFLKEIFSALTNKKNRSRYYKFIKILLSLKSKECRLKYRFVLCWKSHIKPLEIDIEDAKEVDK